MREDLLMDPGNNLRQVREARMLSKAELARRAGISPLTIDRIEKGCRAGLLLAAKSYWLWDSNFLSGEESLRRTEALTILSPIHGLDANVLECIRHGSNTMKRRSVQSQANSGLPTQLIPVAFRRKSPFLYFRPRDK